MAVLAAVTLALVMLAPAASRRLAGQLALLLAGAHALSPLAGAKLAARAGLFVAAPFMLVAALATIGAVLAQTGGLVHLGALAPDFSRLSPQRGIARIFSIGGLLEAAKALAKVAAAGAAAWVVLAGALPLLPTALAWNAPTLLAHTMHEAVRVLTVVIAVQAAIAGLDILHTRIRHAGEMRMSRHELREEHKETEGNPQIKARIRRLRMARVRRRMMAAVPKATVVVNPTHYAVALSYQRGSTAAPRVVAKGVDEVAARIREVAEQTSGAAGRKPAARARPACRRAGRGNPARAVRGGRRADRLCLAAAEPGAVIGRWRRARAAAPPGAAADRHARRPTRPGRRPAAPGPVRGARGGRPARRHRAGERAAAAAGRAGDRRLAGPAAGAVVRRGRPRAGLGGARAAAARAGEPRAAAPDPRPPRRSGAGAGHGQHRRRAGARDGRDRERRAALAARHLPADAAGGAVAAQPAVAGRGAARRRGRARFQQPAHRRAGRRRRDCRAGGAGRVGDDAETRDDLAQIRASAERGAALVRQLLAFGRRQTLQPRVLAINEVLEDMRGLLRRLLGSNVRLDLALEQPGQRVRADRTALDQVLLNLAVNARDAMPAGRRADAAHRAHDALPRRCRAGRRRSRPGAT